jgi:hypothetical protein
MAIEVVQLPLDYQSQITTKNNQNNLVAIGHVATKTFGYLSSPTI